MGRRSKKKLSTPWPQTPERSAACQHFGVCGGCRLQHLDYASQLQFKHDTVSALFNTRLAEDGGQLLPILEAPDEWHYRNKLEFSFSDQAFLTTEQIASRQRFEGGALGFHAPRFFAKAVDIDECWLGPPIVNDLRNWLREYCQTRDLPFRNAHNHTGLMRNFLVRTTRAGQILIALVIAEDRAALIDEIFGAMRERFPEVSAWYWVLNNKKNDSIADLPFRHWGGEQVLRESLGEAQFVISPKAFFQTNTAQAERLYASARSALEQGLSETGSSGERLYDLYCGAGTIGLYLRGLWQRLIGVEYVEQAVLDAQANARLNGVPVYQSEKEAEQSADESAESGARRESAHFVAGDMEAILRGGLFAEQGAADAVIVDPPRAGMSAGVVEALIEQAPPVLVYISCKPSTQEHDMALLGPHYRLRTVQVVDMFPQTPHVESVALLVHRRFG